MTTSIYQRGKDTKSLFATVMMAMILRNHLNLQHAKVRFAFKKRHFRYFDEVSAFIKTLGSFNPIALSDSEDDFAGFKKKGNKILFSESDDGDGFSQSAPKPTSKPSTLEKGTEICNLKGCMYFFCQLYTKIPLQICLNMALTPPLEQR